MTTNNKKTINIAVLILTAFVLILALFAMAIGFGLIELGEKGIQFLF